MRLAFALAVLSLFAGCAYRAAEDPGPLETEGSVATAPGARSDVVLRALGLIGVPYRYGGRSPDTGFDCSGLAYYVFSGSGVELPRRAQEMSHVGEPVPRDELAPGDLVFFDTLREPFSHVGIYIGNNRFIHAPSNGGRVGIVTLTQRYWLRRYNGARRIVY